MGLSFLPCQRNKPSGYPPQSVAESAHQRYRNKHRYCFRQPNLPISYAPGVTFTSRKPTTTAIVHPRLRMTAPHLFFEGLSFAAATAIPFERDKQAAS